MAIRGSAWDALSISSRRLETQAAPLSAVPSQVVQPPSGTKAMATSSLSLPDYWPLTFPTRVRAYRLPVAMVTQSAMEGTVSCYVLVMYSVIAAARVNTPITDEGQ